MKREDLEKLLQEYKATDDSRKIHSLFEELQEEINKKSLPDSVEKESTFLNEDRSETMITSQRKQSFFQYEAAKTAMIDAEESTHRLDQKVGESTSRIVSTERDQSAEDFLQASTGDDERYFGAYEHEKVLGKGGMGLVHRVKTCTLFIEYFFKERFKAV